jgi:flagellar basal-body rod modification protein FlgD
LTTISATASATQPTAALTGSGPAATSSSSSNANIGDRFLTLLVTQLRNQDPLNPMDNSQMTSQLAQISTVTGINKLNDTMSSLSASLGSNQYLQAAGLVGHDVLVAGNKLQLAAGAAAAGIRLASDADHVVVTISDASGRAVRQIDLGAQTAGAQTLTWDGHTDAGATAADGQYTFTVQATQGGTAVTADALMSGRVDGVVLGTNGSTQVQLGRLGRVDLSQLIEIN